MAKKNDADHNERLFGNGIRGKLHSGRFEWLKRSLFRLGCEYRSVLELGCYDAKVINYLRHKPTSYLGLDVNWECGLDIAKEKWTQQKHYTFRHCSTPEEMGCGAEQYDISICMETLEYVPPHMVAPYLEELAKATKKHILVTVPNEIGPVFFFKYITKRLCGFRIEAYTAREFICQTLGCDDKVEPQGHKAFDYRKMVK